MLTKGWCNRKTELKVVIPQPNLLFNFQVFKILLFENNMQSSQISWPYIFWQHYVLVEISPDHSLFQLLDKTPIVFWRHPPSLRFVLLSRDCISPSAINRAVINKQVGLDSNVFKAIYKHEVFPQKLNQKERDRHHTTRHQNSQLKEISIRVHSISWFWRKTASECYLRQETVVYKKYDQFSRYVKLGYLNQHITPARTRLILQLYSPLLYLKYNSSWIINVCNIRKKMNARCAVIFGDNYIKCFRPLLLLIYTFRRTSTIEKIKTMNDELLWKEDPFHLPSDICWKWWQKSISSSSSYVSLSFS